MAGELPPTQLPTSVRVPLLMLVGIPGSGKSTWAQRFVASHPGYQIVSTDAIRASLYGDEASQGDWLQVWQQVLAQWQQGIEAIRQGHIEGLIYDATNARRRHRREAIATARQFGFTAITLCWFDVSLEVALGRNGLRSRQVPDEIVGRMHRQLQGAPPAISEGADQILRFSGAEEPYF